MADDVHFTLTLTLGERYITGTCSWGTAGEPRSKVVRPIVSAADRVDEDLLFQLQEHLTTAQGARKGWFPDQAAFDL